MSDPELVLTLVEMENESMESSKKSQVQNGDTTGRFEQEEIPATLAGHLQAAIETLVDGLVVLSPATNAMGGAELTCEYICAAAYTSSDGSGGGPERESFPRIVPGYKANGLASDLLTVLESGQPLEKDYLEYQVVGGQQRLERAISYQAVKWGAMLVLTWKDVTGQRLREMELNLRSRDLSVINRASWAFNSTLDLDEVLDRVLEEIRQEFDASGAFWLLDQAKGELVCRQASGPDRDIVRGWRLNPDEGIVGWVVKHGESLNVYDASLDERHYKGIEEEKNSIDHSILTVPLVARGKVIGALQLIDKQKERFDSNVQSLVEALGQTAAIAIENANLFEQVQQLAITNDLTGLYNRRGFFALAQQELDLARRTQSKFILVYVDVDDLKWINDHFGHETGDQALQATADILRKTFRESDLKAHIGGDEFVVMAVNSRRSNHDILLSRLEGALQAYNELNKQPFKLSFSVGLAHSDPKFNCTIDDLLMQADRSMYMSKAGKKPKSLDR